MMATPPMMLSSYRERRSACPTTPALAPSSTKIVEKPSTNNRSSPVPLGAGCSLIVMMHLRDAGDWREPLSAAVAVASDESNVPARKPAPDTTESAAVAQGRYFGFTPC